MAAILGKVRISDQAQIHVDTEILRANGNLMKDLEGQTKGEKEVKVAKLTLKRKVRWSKGVKKFPEELLKDFQTEAPKPEAELREGRTQKKEPKKKSLARVVAPAHDFVLPPVAKGSKRKASTQTPSLRVALGAG